MTSKDKHGYRVEFGSREYEPLTTTELKGLIESLQKTQAGTTILEFRSAREQKKK
jgi:hypothetical protein